MAEENAAENTAAQAASQVQMRVLGQFIRDMSFENVMAQKGVSGDVQPEIQVQVNLDAKKRQVEHQYEVSIKLKLTSKAKGMDDVLFLCADHGCDPTWEGTDHTREHIPVLAYGKGVEPGTIGKRETFADIGQSVAAFFNLPPADYGKSFLNE